MSIENVPESAFGRLINISARQRMLSQRIGFLFQTINMTLKQASELPRDYLEMLKASADTFDEGYRVLKEGMPEENLPHLDTARIRRLLQVGGANSGQAIIDRFREGIGDGIRLFSQGISMDEKDLDTFSRFILVDVLDVLQNIVAAIEADFSDEMERRHSCRNKDIGVVMTALQDIQKASRFSRMIALNAKISADRAGPYGREFGALTDELKTISNSITASSEDILKHLQHP